MSVMFVDENRKRVMLAWHDRFRGRIQVPVQDATLATSFGSTHVLIAGPEAAPPLVVLHGALASSAHVLPELSGLVKSHRVYVVDVIGQSPLSEDRRLSLDDDSYGRWMTEVSDGLALPRFALLGVSWGGFVAMKAATSSPDRLTHLILLVPAGLVKGDVWAGLRDMAWPLLRYRMSRTQTNLERVANGVFTTLDPMWTPYFGEALTSYKLDMRAPPLLPASELAKVKCPVLVFAAEHDVHFPGSKLLARARALMPQSETELLRGSKHSPPFTDDFRTMLASRIQLFLAGSRAGVAADAAV